MIKANELRLGNYLYDDTNRFFQVKQIGIGLIESYGAYIYSIEEINPIKLTEEILLKIKGVKKHKNIENRYVLKDSTYSFNIEDGNWEQPSLDIMLNGMYITCVENLHELQNVIFWLQREELTINL